MTPPNFLKGIFDPEDLPHTPRQYTHMSLLSTKPRAGKSVHVMMHLFEEKLPKVIQETDPRSKQ